MKRMALGNNMNLKQHITVQGAVKSEQEESKNSNENINPENKSSENNLAEQFAVPEYLESISAQNLEIIFTPSRRKTTRRIQISVSGEFTVQNIGLLNKRMSAITANYDYIDFILKNILQIDLAAVQMLYTIKHLFTPQGKFISIDAVFSREDNELLESCGFKELFLKPRLTA